MIYNIVLITAVQKSDSVIHIIYIYIYTHIYIHTYIYIHIHIYIYIHNSFKYSFPLWFIIGYWISFCAIQ